MKLGEEEIKTFRQLKWKSKAIKPFFLLNELFSGDGRGGLSRAERRETIESVLD